MRPTNQVRLRAGVALIALLALASSAAAQTVGTCPRSLGEAYLDVNNVRARILNTGGLFYRGEPHVYEVPKGSGSNAVFATTIWLAGLIDGELHASASRYGEWEMWAGPLDDQGNPPADCTVYDRVYKVSRSDVEAYEEGNDPAPDLRDWPTGLGAPTLAPPGNEVDDDEDGEIDEEGELLAFDIDVPLAQREGRVIDLEAGERPAILGDQSIWWVMNDRGNVHKSTDVQPIGVEVHATAFAFDVARTVGNTTFYRYRIFLKGADSLRNAYFGIFSDPDLGDFNDDYVGSDTTLGMGYVYNADNEDVSGEGYGTPPPALGYDFVRGPVVPSPGDTANVDFEPVPGFRNLQMAHFLFYAGGGCVLCDPQWGPDYYYYLQGRWRDGKKMTLGGPYGRDFSDIPVDAAFPGDPVTGSGWTELTPDPFEGSLPPNRPSDRRFVMSTGPFTVTPGKSQEVIFAVVWAIGADHLDSVSELRKASVQVQRFADANFELPPPPAGPDVTVTELNGQIILEWENGPRSNNYLESYSRPDPFAPDEDKNYEFEGYDVIQYADVADQTGQIIATYDVANGVTRVIDGAPGDVQTVVATGSDRGVQRFHAISNLVNYETYHFGVQAYAYNEPSFPKIYRGPISRVEVIPTKSRTVLSNEAEEAAQSSSVPDITASFVGAGEGRAWADVVNPGKVTGLDYTIEFYALEDAAGKAAPVPDLSEPDFIGDELPAAKTAAAAGGTTYNVVREDGQVMFDGSATGSPAPQRENVLLVDGLQLSIVGPQADIKGFAAVQNAAGAIDPPDMASYAFNSSGFPMLEETGITPAGSYPDPDRPTRGVQQANSNAVWGFHTGGNRSTWTQYLDRTLFSRGHTIEGSLGSNDFEIRFTQRCVDSLSREGGNPSSCIGWRRFEDDLPMEIPFEVWNTGPTADPGDDFRLLPAILDNGAEAWHLSTPTDTVYQDLDTFDIGGDHPASGGANDPSTDWVYWYNPADTSPGEAGYQQWAADAVANQSGNGSPFLGSEIMGRTVLVNWNGWSDADGDGQYDTVDAELPEVGTIYKIITTKPSQPGDVFTLQTAGLGVRERTQDEKEAALEEIGIVPNPYKGASIYERSQLIDEVRFTNLPEVATIRVFTLHGVLIKTINKSGSERTAIWNLRTENRLPIASGLYLVHVEVPGVGEQVIKFAVVKKQPLLPVY